jgi:hypothetical protein
MLERFYDLLTQRTGIVRTIDSRLEFAARYRSQEAVTQVGYDASGGGIPHPTATERRNLLGWPAGFGTAEMAIWGYLLGDPVEWAADGLMDSPPHATILNEPAWTHWGAGHHSAFKPGDDTSNPLLERHYFLLWFSIGVPAVKAIVYNGTSTTDALSASYLSAKYAAPLFPVQKSLIPATIRTAIEDLDPLEILVIGGTGVVDESVATALTTIAPVKRIAGADRYATAVEVSRA